MNKPICAFCGEYEGDIPIVDSETQTEVLICSYCNESQKWELSKNSKSKPIKKTTEVLIKGIEKLPDSIEAERQENFCN